MNNILQYKTIALIKISTTNNLNLLLLSIADANVSRQRLMKNQLKTTIAHILNLKIRKTCLTNLSF